MLKPETFIGQQKPRGAGETDDEPQHRAAREFVPVCAERAEAGDSERRGRNQQGRLIRR